MPSLTNSITQVKVKFEILFASSFKDNEDDETLYGWYDAILEGN